MKNLLLLFALLCIASTTQAQFTTGQKMIGGQLSGGFNESTTSASAAKNKAGDVTLALSFSKFTSPTQFNSVGFSYGYAHTANTGTSNETESNIHIFSIFVERTKLQQLTKRFYFTYTGSINATYRLDKDKNTVSSVVTDETRDGYLAYVSGSIGLLYQLNERFIFTSSLSNLLSVNYQHYDIKTTVGAAAPLNSQYNGFRLLTGLSGLSLNNLSIGVKYILKK